ncbi:MAG TPA: thioredoxin family protein [Terracidiphilus sp.]|jgi:thiol:disulfide interchange protein DsbD
MRRYRLIFALVLLFATGRLALAASNSADVAHLHVQLVVPSSTLYSGGPVEAGLYFKLEPGWHVYWKNAGDSGEPPRIKWTLPAGITAGPLQFPAPKRLPLGPLMDFGYENEVLFPFNLNVAANAALGPALLHAKVDWLVCREVCIPGKAELEATRPVTNEAPKAGTVDPDASLYARLASRVPQAPPATFKAGFTPTPTGFRLTVETGQKETEASFFPADQSVLDNPAPQKVTSTAKGLTLDLKKDANLTANPTHLNGVLELANGRAYEVAAVAGAPAAVLARPSALGPINSSSPANSTSTTNSANSAAPGFARIAFLAFLGGIILNLMPCVFPVLFLKGLALMQSGNEERHRLRTHGLVYTAGILVSFWILVAVLLVLRGAGSRFGWGFQFQSPVFLSLMAGLLFFLALSLAGQFEIGLTLTSAGGSLAAKQGYTGSFFTGVLAVVVATPCTAPFMGVAIGYALAQPAVVTFAVFTSLALGLAAPYAALTLQPAWTRILPKPGAWMEILRQAISVPIFATVIWLAWVLAQAYGATLLAALLIGFLLIAIAGWFLGRWPARLWSTILAVLVLAAFVALSAWGPKHLASAPATATASTQPGAWQPWTADAVSRYQAQGRPVFVDFTASWCLSCQVNERVALSQPAVRKAFADANVVLLRADWTQHDEDIAQTLAALGRSGVPAYALYAPGEKTPRLLPEVLTPGIVTDALANLPRTANQASLVPSNLK